MNIKNKTVLIFDGTNLAKRIAFAGHVKISDTEIDYDIFNYSIGNSIYLAAIKHRANCVILASDNSSGRKLIYPAYKLNRRLDSKKRKERNEPTIDWDEFFSKLNEFSSLLADNLPFIYLTEPNCEADDIIAITAKELSVDNKVIVVSSDQDYKQLLKHKNIKQYDPHPSKNKFVKLAYDADDGINVMALHGQGKDNIYNVFTAVDFPIEYNIMREDSSIKCLRKPLLSEKKAWEIVKSNNMDTGLDIEGPKEAKRRNKAIIEENKIIVANNIKNNTNLPEKPLYVENVRERFNVNKKLMSFDLIPLTLTNRVLSQLNEYKIPTDTDFYLFFKELGGNGVLDNFERVENTLLKMF